jgi:hypothetical protein
MAAIPIAASVLGGMGGKSKAKEANKPTKTYSKTTPPSQLGGWGKLQEIMASMKDAPQYRVGANNPYLSGGMAHIMGRAGMAAPEGGYGPNPYLQTGGGGAPPQAAPPPPAPPPAVGGLPGKVNPKIKGGP